MKKELGHEAIYDARQLGTPRMLVLGLQHMFAMFGATVLVPILVQGYGLPLSIQTTLLFAGLGTLLFHVCTKMKVPAFLGSSFAYLGGFETVAKLDAGKYAGMSGDEKLAYALGGIVIAGLLYLVLALLFKMLGAKKVMRYFPPIVTGPMIIMIGLNLSGSAINNAATCWWLALIAMAIIVVANIWGKGMVKIIPILLGVVGSYLVALIATACGAQLPDAAARQLCLRQQGEPDRPAAVRHRQVRRLRHPRHGPHRHRRHDGAHRRRLRHLLHHRQELHRGPRSAPHPRWRRSRHCARRYVRRPRQHHLR